MSDHAPLPDAVAELHALVLEQQASIKEQQASFEKISLLNFEWVVNCPICT
ncbi:MAG: hypothetical protein VB142_11750 [Burkholderia sp.]